MILIILVTIFLVGVSLWIERLGLASLSIIICAIILMLFPVSDIGYDNTNTILINSNWTINCYKASPGGLFSPDYLKVDCNVSKEIDVIKNESEGKTWLEKWI